MHRLAALALVVGCSAPTHSPHLVLGEPPSAFYEPAKAMMMAGGWEVDVDPVLGTMREMRGSGVPVSTLDFIGEHLDLIGTTEFAPAGEVVSDSELDDGLASYQFAQRYNGLPVIGGHLGLTASHGRLTLAQGVTFPIHDLETAPAVDLAAAIATARDHLPTPKAGDRDDARLVVLPMRTHGAVTYHLAWEVSAWRGETQAIVFVDAHRGAILDAYDATRYEYAGVAKNNVDERTVGDAVVNKPASYLQLHTTTGHVTVTDANGAFAFRGQAAGLLGGGPLFVNANLTGRYVTVLNLAGDNAKFIGVMRPEKQYTLEWTESRSTPEERDVFRGTNETNRFVSTVYPEIEWLQHPLLAKVNHARTCNAFWNGSSINFFQAGNGCNNSGRIFDVIAHEWGHGFDQNAPGDAIDGGLGEFIGDLMSFIQTKSPLLGPNFFTNGRAVRNMEDPNYECFDPEIRQVHAAGNVLGTVVWDIMNDLERAGVKGEDLKRLLLRPIAIAQTRFQWYGAMLAVDDDDGNLANGTPHECLIYNQFKAHSCKGVRWPGLPANDPPGC